MEEEGGGESVILLFFHTSSSSVLCCDGWMNRYLLKLLFSAHHLPHRKFMSFASVSHCKEGVGYE